MTWTTEQVLNLAPDTASAKAGQGLANARKWQTLGANEQAAWGLCQGSGKEPYQTQIELHEPAFKCSCPSRKFPCKHGLGLLLLLATQANQFKEKAAPVWVNEWLANRTKRSEQKAAKAEAAAEKPVDEKAQAKRAEAREKKVAAGIADLQLWMNDVIRGGLAHALSQPHSFWERPAARLVDAQAPGLARMVRELAGLPASGADWQSRLLARLGKLQLLLDGFQRLEQLPPDTQADIRNLCGWTFNQQELLEQPSTQDIWAVLGLRTIEENGLRTQRVWLYGETSQHVALVLQFAHGQQPFPAQYATGQVFKGEVVFFPSAYPLRALVKEGRTPHEGDFAFQFCPDFDTAFGHYAEALARSPWIESFPFLLHRATPFVADERGWLRDTNGTVLPIHPRFENVWRMIAVSGGHPINAFAEWDGATLWPLWADATNEFQEAAQ